MHGHSGELIHGTIDNASGPINCVCFSGRVHWYEGYGFGKVNFFARLAAAIGCKLLVLTNSAGGCITDMKPVSNEHVFCINGKSTETMDCIGWYHGHSGLAKDDKRKSNDRCLR